MARIIKILIPLFMFITAFLLFDFTISYLGYSPFSEDRKFIAGKKHGIYHHDLKENLDNEAQWGPIKYPICTNEYGFKISCLADKYKSKNNYDIAFIGDSFTEAVGMSYENSFVGHFAKNNPDISVANLGVSSYSPIIYLKKIEYLLNNGFKFNHVIVLPDISDIQDEAFFYSMSADGKAVIDNNYFINSQKTNLNPSISKKIKRAFDRNFKFSRYIRTMVKGVFKKGEPANSLDNVDALKVEDYDKQPERAAWTYNPNASGYGDGGVQEGISHSIKYMEELKKLLDTHNIKMSVVVYPWPAQLIHNKNDHAGVTLWKNFCSKVECYNFIDANKFFYDQIKETSIEDTVKKYYIAGDSHFNEAGNEAIYTIISNIENKN